MLRSYLKFAWRHLRRSFGYSLINIVGLALGIGSVLLIFLYVQHELSFDEYHENKDRIYRITAYAGLDESSWRAGTPGDPVPELRDNYATVTDGVRMMSCGGGELTANGERHSGFDTYCTETNLFSVFTFPLISQSREELLEAPFTAVISRSAAERIYGEENPVGRTFRMPWGFQGGTESFEITGVMEDIPANTHFRHDIYLSLSSLQTTGRCMDCGGQSQYLVLSEEADTASLTDNILNHVREIDGKDYVEEIGLQPLDEVHFSSLHAPRKGDWQYIQILSAIALVILIIGCGNYVNMATARYSKRAREIGIRKVMGAYRSQLARQFFTETVLLAVISLPLALSLVYTAIPWFNTYAGTEITLSLFSNTLFPAAVAGVILLTGLLAGTYPAMFISGFRPREVLQGNASVGPGSAGIRKGLVAFQFLASLVMVGITILILQQLSFVQGKNLGFDTDRIVSVSVNDPTLQGQPQRIKESFLQRASVEAATASSAPATGGFAGVRFVFEPDTSSDETFTVTTPRVDEDFLKTFRINLLAGRNLEPPSSSDSGPVSEGLINQTGYLTLGYPNPEAILGETVGNRFRIVGVVEDFHMESLQNEIVPAILMRNPFGRAYTVNVRLTGGSISEGLDDLRSAWLELGASTPLNYQFVDDQIQEQYENERRTARVIGVFATLSIIIACMGLFGMASYTVQQRKKEIGIRKVLGAGVNNIIFLLYKDFGKLITVAAVISLPVIHYAGSQWLQNFAYRIDIGPMVYLLAVLTVVLVTFLATGARSLQAALMNPVDSIRQE